MRHADESHPILLADDLVGARAPAGEEAKLIDLLVEVRARARQAKQYDLADFIRSQLSELGIALEDTRQGTVWRRSV